MSHRLTAELSTLRAGALRESSAKGLVEIGGRFQDLSQKITAELNTRLGASRESGAKRPAEQVGHPQGLNQVTALLSTCAGTSKSEVEAPKAAITKLSEDMAAITRRQDGGSDMPVGRAACDAALAEALAEDWTQQGLGHALKSACAVDEVLLRAKAAYQPAEVPTRLR